MRNATIMTVTTAPGTLAGTIVSSGIVSTVIVTTTAITGAQIAMIIILRPALTGVRQWLARLGA